VKAFLAAAGTLITVIASGLAIYQFVFKPHTPAFSGNVVDYSVSGSLISFLGQHNTETVNRPSLPPGGVLFKAYLSMVTLHPGGVQIERSKIGRVNGNHSSTLAWEELAGVDFLNPNIFRNGYVHFATATDPRGLSATGRGNRMAAAARNPHAVLFAWHQKRSYERLRALLSATSSP
jgi:hypothetical protein